MENSKLEEKVEILVELTRHNLVLSLFMSGATQDDICKSLHMSKTKVVDMLKGVKRDK
ncbi:MAG: hypothetical protein NT155_00750 [Candidatus Staskawiczbacteria bacterium]|nr:hypothetical protein [Candidatus Staskawiczbacteria bacterium]